MTQYQIIEGQYDLIPYAQKWAIPGTFPRRYWDIVEVEDEEDLAAYLSGQQNFIKEEKHTHAYEPSGNCYQIEHICARCKKPCKPQFLHCYRCNQYIRVKARIAKDI